MTTIRPLFESLLRFGSALGVAVSLSSALQAAPTALAVQAVPSLSSGAPHELEGKLDSGATVDLKWAASSAVACFPATENVNFNGSHVLYRVALPAYSDMTVTVMPTDPKLDVSVYAYQVGPKDTKTLPPNVASVVACEAGYDSKKDSNPGKPESLKVNSIKDPYSVVIGVAGANATTKGAFKLKIDLKTNAPAAATPPLVANALEMPAGGAPLEVQGKLEAGAPASLGWAANSSVACFPATENVNFTGNHVLYRVALPAYSDMNVTVTPSDPSLDVSVYAYQVGPKDTTTVPPNVPSVLACEAGYDQQKDKNPGKTESVKLNSIKNPYNVFIGVAGANATTKGAFKLKIALKTNAPAAATPPLVANALEMPAGGAPLEVQGKLEAGAPASLGWAANSSVACFPATENVNFTGNHVLYRVALPAYSDMSVTVTPSDPSLDVSVYAYQVGPKDTTTVPPNVPSVLACEAGYDQQKDKNPGKTESVKLNSIKNPYNVFIGVAGANATTKGAFKLKIDLKTNAPAAATPPLVANALEMPAGGAPLEVQGKLEAGAPASLGWAANSSVACFPATENVNFTGNHVLYRVALPAYSDMNVTVTPSDPSLDVSVYAYQVGAKDTTTVPPNVSSVLACEAGYDQQKDKNPGKAESVKLNSIKNPYNVFIGVAGANATTKGAFKLKIDLKTNAPAAATPPLVANALEMPAGGAPLEVQGKLEAGAPASLGWAANSAVACFPATENVNFNGNHVLYRVALPAYSDMNVTVTPSDPSLDVSVYAYQVGAKDTTTVPPNISSVLSCEAGYDAPKDKNPGKAESLKMNSIKNPYNVFIGVAGANATTKGSYTLKIEQKKKP